MNPAPPLPTAVAGIGFHVSIVLFSWCEFALQFQQGHFGLLLYIIEQRLDGCILAFQFT